MEENNQLTLVATNTLRPISLRVFIKKLYYIVCDYNERDRNDLFYPAFLKKLNATRNLFFLNFQNL